MDHTGAFMAELTSGVMMMMGLSFVLGSFFTILILILLDFMQLNKKDD